MQSIRRTMLLSTAVTAALAATVYAQSAGLGGETIKFPADPGKMYATVDRADVKQVRELHGNAAAIEAAKAGQPLPNGSVLTMVLYKAKLDAKGDAEKDAGGRLIKEDMLNTFVMEKQAAFGAGVPADLRNGSWEYQVFTPAKAVNDKANIKGCYECHRDKSGAGKDFLFSADRMK
jgi:hypothetical protein